MRKNTLRPKRKGEPERLRQVLQAELTSRTWRSPRPAGAHRNQARDGMQKKLGTT